METAGEAGAGKSWEGTRMLKSSLGLAERELWLIFSKLRADLKKILCISARILLCTCLGMIRYTEGQLGSSSTERKVQVKTTHQLCKFMFRVIHPVIAKDRVSLLQTSLSPHHCSWATVSRCSFARDLRAKRPSTTWGDTARVAEMLRPDPHLPGRNILCHLCSRHSYLFKAFISLLTTRCSLIPLIPFRYLSFWASISCTFPRPSSMCSSFLVPLDTARWRSDTIHADLILGGAGPQALSTCSWELWSTPSSTV